MANCQWLWWVLIVFRGGCEKRGVVTCDIGFVISPHWDVLNAIASTFILNKVLSMGLIWECAAVCISLQLISIFDWKIR